MKKQLLFSLAFVFTLSVFGQKLPFQGKLIETGVPVDGSRNLEFSIASQSWSETHYDVPIIGGLYFVVLGSINPLPNNLFSVSDEESLDISVDGTALSPVILFKPLLPPLNIKNDANVPVAIIGVKDVTQNGELIINGSNGNPNVSMLGFGPEGNRGSMQIHDENGDAKANMFTAKNSGVFSVLGETGGSIQGMFQWWNPATANLPALYFDGNTGNNIYLNVNNRDSKESGQIGIKSTADEEMVLTPSAIWMKRSAADNNGSQGTYAQVVAENWNGSGIAGYIGVSGPTTTNVSIGAHNDNRELPVINLYGINKGNGDFHAMELSVLPDDNGDQYGFINLWSENGKSLHLSPGNMGVQGVSMSTSINNSGTFGSLSLHGPNSDNFQFMPSWWDKPDLPRMLLLGTSQIAAVDLGADLDGQQNEVGFISISSTDGSSASWRPGNLALNNTSGGQTIALETINNGLGEFGELRLNGSNGNPNVRFTGGGNEGNFGEFQLYNENGNSTLSFTPLGGAGLLTVFGESGGGVKSGFKFWEPNGGSNRPFQALEGTVRPGIGLVFSHIAGDNSIEYGEITLGSTDDKTGNFSSYELRFDENGNYMLFNATGINGSLPIEIQNGANITGTLNLNGDFTGSGTQYYSSDRRLKTNIQPLGNNTIQKIELIEGVSYDWRQDEFPEKNFSSDKQIGVIAQELEAQFPELVKTNNDGYKSVNYNGFTAVLLEAVKELNSKVEKLETENIQLKAELTASTKNTAEIDALKKQMEALTQMVRQNLLTETTISEEILSTPGLK
ncbi:MAG TPA: tail fiber domain-containing protein [Draconibacterium sp.]|nr:tail fiber domain-containing protein [Draconibacterium sp.]